ncbi:MAG TPA: hypothetical protein VLC06_08465 [Polyangia bacterium]|nr:hypothetical protein [Polyangia bacterium]
MIFIEAPIFRLARHVVHRATRRSFVALGMSAIALDRCDLNDHAD